MASKDATLKQQPLGGHPELILPFTDGRMADLSATDWVAPQNFLGRGIESSLDGTVRLVLVDHPDDDSVYVDVKCVAGIVKPYVFKKILRVGCSAALQVAGVVAVGY